MKLNTLFIITAIIALVYGILFVIVPEWIYSLYGIESFSVLNYMGRLFGAALIGIGLIAWLSKNVSVSDAKKAIILSFFIADGIGFIIAIIGQLNGVVNGLGWLTVVIYLFLTVFFGISQFSGKESVQNPAQKPA